MTPLKHSKPHYCHFKLSSFRKNEDGLKAVCAFDSTFVSRAQSLTLTLLAQIKIGNTKYLFFQVYHHFLRLTSGKLIIFAKHHFP